ncbi:hypothetical protein GCM10009839_69700 [Catenulispora yoronensis]|uniref:IrrE N-terminal-like domain-containing protein n=1 Tax=Catenulispora yoronensis TaxID=450799 RepID=A0ABN2VBI6_9ACTN
MARARPLDKVRSAIAGITIPRPFSIEALCERLAQDRGRPLQLLPLPQLPGQSLPCGMWIATDTVDYIFHARGTSPLHRQNIVLHEIGHMLCDHTGRDAGLAQMFSRLDPAAVERVLARDRYSTPQEEEAELAAAFILERAGWHGADTTPFGDLDDLF